MPYRNSNYIDFDGGTVTIAPMQLVAQKTAPLTIDDKIDLFECRVDVWQLGTAVATLTAIETNQPPNIWSHAAYGLLACGITYFEMIGNTNNRSRARLFDTFIAYCLEAVGRKSVCCRYQIPHRLAESIADQKIALCVPNQWWPWPVLRDSSAGRAKAVVFTKTTLSLNSGRKLV